MNETPLNERQQARLEQTKRQIAIGVLIALVLCSIAVFFAVMASTEAHLAQRRQPENAKAPAETAPINP